jgi:hypothetical protein
MARSLRGFVLLLVLSLAACAPPGPPFASVAATLPPPPPGAARIFFYRWLEPYETISESTIYLNDKPVASSQTGAAFYRDVAAGQYTIRAHTFSHYPFDTKTVVLAPGQVIYVRIESVKTWGTCAYNESGCFDTFVVNLIDPAVAQYEMQQLRMIPG